MANTFLERGNVLTVTNSTGSDLSSGDAILAAGCLRVLILDVDNGDTGPAYCEGVFTVPAVAVNAWDDGVPLYWNDTLRKLTTVSGGNYCVGFASGAKVAGTGTADIKLWPVVNTVPAVTPTPPVTPTPTPAVTPTPTPAVTPT